MQSWRARRLGSWQLVFWNQSFCLGIRHQYTKLYIRCSLIEVLFTSQSLSTTMLRRPEFLPSPRSSASTPGIEQTFETHGSPSKAQSQATQNGRDPYAEVWDWLLDRGCSPQNLVGILADVNRIQLPLEDDFVCLRKLRCFAQTEKQGSFELSEDITSRFKDTYRQEQDDFNKRWSDFRWTKMVELGLSVPSDIGCEWNNYLSSNAHNSVRRIYMAIAPCIDSCHSNGHSHASHSKVRKRRNLKNAPSTPSHSLRRSPRIRNREEARKIRL